MDAHTSSRAVTGIACGGVLGDRIDDTSDTARAYRMASGPVLAGLVLMVFIIDEFVGSSEPPYAVLGILDELAHLATSAVVIAAVHRVRPTPRAALVAALSSTVLIDVDHIPQMLGNNLLTEGTPRPYSHSLTTVLVLATVALVTMRSRPLACRLAGGATAGVVLHLLRDLATAPVSVWWPLTSRPEQIPYVAYAAVLLLAAALPNPVGIAGRRVRKRRRTRPTRRPRGCQREA